MDKSSLLRKGRAFNLTSHLLKTSLALFMSYAMNPYKKIPFYRTVICTKALGGKRPLWHAKSRDSKYERITGAGATADYAIADLQKQIKLQG